MPNHSHTIAHSLLHNRTLLMVHYGDNWLRGSEHCLLNLCHALKTQGYQPIVWCNAPALAEALKACDLPCYCEPMSIVLGYQKKHYDLAAWYKQMKFGMALITQWKPALVHINSAAPCQWMLAACAFTNTPNITQLHAHYGTFKDRLSLGLHFCNNIIGVSHAAIRALDEDGKNPNQTCTILPNAIDAKTLLQQKPVNIKQALGLKKQDTLLLSVGSLIKRKGHRFLIDNIKQLNHHHKPHYLAIIGDGEELDTLKAQCEALGLTHHVFFLGNKTNAFGYMQGDADALVSTALDEVFGLVLAEANLAKLPVIAPNIKGINSVIKHKKTGILYTPNSASSLQQSILSLANKSVWQTYIHRGHYRAKTTFNSQKHIYATIKAYEKAIEINQQKSALNTLNKIIFVAKITLKWAVIKLLPKSVLINRFSEATK